MRLTNRLLSRAASLISLIAGIAIAGCAAGPPRQLLDARASYALAAKGRAGSMTPAELVDAKKALDTAERRFDEQGVTDAVIDAAYVAQRRAEIAAARGEIAYADAGRLASTEELARLREKRLTHAEGDLAASQAEGSLTKEKLRATDKALAEEKELRADSERRLRQAMERLVLAASLAVKDEPRGTVITLPGNVLFATAKSALLPGAMSKLDAVADALKDQPDAIITVEGHTDSQGTPASNLVLAAARAESVRAYLESKGVAKKQLHAAGIGEVRPVGDNNTMDGRAQNRRVEIVITQGEKR